MTANSQYHWTGVVILLIGILTSGCATTPLPQPTGMSPALYQRLLSHNQWHITGKLGYREDDKGGSAWLDWQQQGSRFELNLRGPFGAGATQILGADDHATLSQAGHEPITAPSAALLTESLFGWSWPIESLLFWVKGIPAPDQSIELAEYDDTHLLTLLQQAGWQLEFSHYHTTSDGLVLPGKIMGRYQQVSFTLLIKQWLPVAGANG